MSRGTDTASIAERLQSLPAAVLLTAGYLIASTNVAGRVKAAWRGQSGSRL